MCGADRAPQSIKFLGISLVVDVVFLGAGVVLFGIRTLVETTSDVSSS